MNKKIKNNQRNMDENFLWAGTLGEFRLCVQDCNSKKFDHAGFEKNSWLYGDDKTPKRISKEYEGTYRASWNELIKTIEVSLDQKIWVICEQYIAIANNGKRPDFTLVGFFPEVDNIRIKSILMLEHKYEVDEANLKKDVGTDVSKLNEIKEYLLKKEWLTNQSGEGGYKKCHLESEFWFFRQPSAFIKKENESIRLTTQQQNVSVATGVKGGWASQLRAQFEFENNRFYRADLVRLSKNLHSDSAKWQD